MFWGFATVVLLLVVFHEQFRKGFAVGCLVLVASWAALVVYVAMQQSEKHRIEAAAIAAHESGPCADKPSGAQLLCMLDQQDALILSNSAGLEANH